jgi:hypothetical protein
MAGTAQSIAAPVRQPHRHVAPAAAGRRAFATRRAPGTAMLTSATSTEFEVLVPPDQLIAIRQLMSSARTGTGGTVAPPPTLIDPETGQLIAPKPIEIPLITVTPLPGDPEGRSGGRENR